MSEAYEIGSVFGPTFGLDHDGWRYTVPVRFYWLLAHPMSGYYFDESEQG